MLGQLAVLWSRADRSQLFFGNRVQGCDPVDILLVKRDGRFSGEAFVVMGSPAEIQMAVEKNKSYLGRRYVEVFKAKKLVRAFTWAMHHSGWAEHDCGIGQRRRSCATS